ncbi:apolipoprotein D-like [Belonocnema kinseyi]|uniref:apolipoprotein D-like n=1 Tax=Belonocnema kinseyi TaxID=2817044 RepID=UPI00143D3CCA|nr:apolipoprotein D-like [Belonocnema kinseyi]
MIQLGLLLLLCARAFAYPALTSTPDPASADSASLPTAFMASAPSTPGAMPAATPTAIPAPTSMTAATPVTAVMPTGTPTSTSTSTSTSSSCEHCKNVQIVQDFDLEEFQGRWYLLGKYATASNLFTKCMTPYWSLNEEGTLDAELALIDVLNNVVITHTGVTTFIGTEGRYTVEYDGVGYGEHWVIYTDYTRISIIFTCGDLAIDGETNLFILGREKQLDKDSFVEVLQFLMDNQLNDVALDLQDWSECPDMTC